MALREGPVAELEPCAAVHRVAILEVAVGRVKDEGVRVLARVLRVVQPSHDGVGEVAGIGAGEGAGKVGQASRTVARDLDGERLAFPHFADSRQVGFALLRLSGGSDAEEPYGEGQEDS